MAELSEKTRDALMRIGTSTLTGALQRRGLRNMFLQDVWPVRPNMKRMVGPAFTMRFIPSREDKDGPGAQGSAQQHPAAGDGGRARRAMCWWSIPAAMRGRRPPAIFTSAGWRRAAVPAS